MRAAAGQAHGRMSAEMGQMNDGVIPILSVSKIAGETVKILVLGEKNELE